MVGMTEETREIYRELWEIGAVKEQPLRYRYRALRESLERVIRGKMQHVSLQTTDLAARINYLSTQFSLNGRQKNALHTFRLTSNDVLNHRKDLSEEELLRAHFRAPQTSESYEELSMVEILDELRERHPHLLRHADYKQFGAALISAGIERVHTVKGNRYKVTRVP